MSWLDRPYVCACCGKELDNDDQCVCDENIPAGFFCGSPQDIYCVDCVRERFDSWLEEVVEMVG